MYVYLRCISCNKKQVDCLMICIVFPGYYTIIYIMCSIKPNNPVIDLTVYKDFKTKLVLLTADFLFL